MKKSCFMLIFLLSFLLFGCVGAELLFMATPVIPDVVEIATASKPYAPKTTLLNSQPLNVPLEATNTIKTIAVSIPIDTYTNPNAILYLTEKLSENQRFRVISPAKFQTIGSYGNLYLMTDREKIRAVREAARSLGADAILVLSSTNPSFKMGIQMLINRSSTETDNHLTLYATDSGDIIWAQTEKVKVTQGIWRSAPSVEAVLQAAIDPLVQDFLRSFPAQQAAAK